MATPQVEAAANSARTEAEARITKRRQDLSGWFPGRHGSGAFGIIGRDGREVARFSLEADRDMVLALIKSHVALEIAAHFTWEAAGESRIDGGDQNPKGWRDLLFSAKEGAKRLFFGGGLMRLHTVKELRELAGVFTAVSSFIAADRPTRSFLLRISDTLLASAAGGPQWEIEECMGLGARMILALEGHDGIRFNAHAIKFAQDLTGHKPINIP